MAGGILEYILSYPCALKKYDFTAYGDEPDPRPGLGIAIWCFRHGYFDPFLSTCSPDLRKRGNLIEYWQDLVRGECWQRRDPVQQESLGWVSYAQEDCDFLLDALSNSLYGPAIIEEWVSKLGQKKDNHMDGTSEQPAKKLRR